MDMRGPGQAARMDAASPANSDDGPRMSHSEGNIGMNVVVCTKDDIVTVLGNNHPQIRALGVKRLGLFGSFVRGEQTAESDVDVLVEFEQGQKTFDHFMDLSFLLEDLLRHRVELVTTEGLSPHIGPKILREVEYVALAA